MSTQWMWAAKVHNCVCNKNEACREDTEAQGTRRSPMDGGNHGAHQEPSWSSAVHTSSWPKVSLTLPSG